VEAKAGELALLADAGVGQPDRRHQIPLAERRQDPGVDLVGLAGQRREALDLLSVGDLDRPAACSSVSWTKGAPVIDSITAQTGSRCVSSIRRARVRSASPSGGEAS